MKLQFMTATYPRPTQFLPPKTTRAYFGHNSFKDKISLFNHHDLLHEIQTGKITGLNALQVLSTRYPNLGYYGSPTANLALLEPEQCIWRVVSNEHIPDGAPSVIAHPDYRLSLFHAFLLNRLNVPHGYNIDNQNGSLIFRIGLTPREWADFKRKNNTGFIYILDPNGMTVHRQVPTERSFATVRDDQKPLEFRSEKPIMPLASVKVTMQDFLNMIQNDPTLHLTDYKNKPLDLTHPTEHRKSQ